jgi:UTP--glucose-1-phosphate uridylyltransferase
LTELTDAQRSELLRHGFDEALLTRWRQALKKKQLSKKANAIQSPLLAPETGSIHDLPRRDSPAGELLERWGKEGVRRGELGVVVLNGGMATRFGGVVKGIVPVLGERRSFLGLKMEDVQRAQERHGGRIEVFLMNSFATEQATQEHFERHGNFGLDPDQVHHFNQFVSVRLTKSGDLFLDEKGELSRYGPGHGDFAPAIRASGLLGQFLARGGKHLFVSNVDNLGARIDAVVLGHHIDSNAEVTVEVAPKWPGDVGGSPFVVDGTVQLVEQIRYPPDFDPEIVDVFNTNTFHFRADALDRDVPLDFYYVEKKVGDRQAVQMERLIGEMTRFLRASYVKVKRTGEENRFFPIKTPEDLEAGRDEIAALYA